MLLWNTRRSGYNVKSFQLNYLTEANFPDKASYPTVTSTWLTASGNKTNGSMYAGRQAQRKLIVAAMKSGIDTSLAAREEQNQFNLIAAPAYPELAVNMVALSNERANTLFVVGDTPMRLGATGTELVTYATDNGGLGLPTEDGLTIGSAYAAVFYPSCQTTDLSGNTVVAPPSHMMVRTILRSDAVSYPWLAPAGTRRGVVDNATAIGYIESTTGEFQQIAVGQSLRDILYENNINPITFIPGVGITNFGNKTRQGATTALDRINVARLVAFLRGRLEEIGKLYLFEPNDQITRNEITNTINSLMIDLIAKRAIYDYLVVCDLSNNTPARIDRNELWVDIAIEPVKAVEFIYIPLRIKNTGEISGLNA
jgi:phage tail sheath protein FI